MVLLKIVNIKLGIAFLQSGISRTGGILMFCIYCGNKLDDDSIFCPKCGKKAEADGAKPSEHPKVEETAHTEEPTETVPENMVVEQPEQTEPDAKEETPVKESSTVFCIYCGNKMDESFVFCPKCGRNQEETAIHPPREAGHTENLQVQTTEDVKSSKSKKISIVLLILTIITSIFFGLIYDDIFPGSDLLIPVLILAQPLTSFAYFYLKIHRFMIRRVSEPLARGFLTVFASICVEILFELIYILILGSIVQ